MYFVYDTKRQKYLRHLNVLGMAAHTFKADRRLATSFPTLELAIADYHKYGGFNSQVQDEQGNVCLDTKHKGWG